MTLQNNTTKINTIKNTTLPELLQKINALPDAGSGGGSGGGYKVATGKISLSEGVKSSGSTIATINGLGFKPSYIMVSLSVSTSAITSTSYYVLSAIYYLPESAQAAVAKRNSANIRFYAAGSYAIIVPNDDGFTIISDNSNLYTGSGYQYIAVGGGD
ncbi:MAG: hypothetical protein IKV80_08270 [Bacteroidales bacterium]|nr:hypothetical protein [Bacteroidales bacterium]